MDLKKYNIEKFDINKHYGPGCIKVEGPIIGMTTLKPGLISKRSIDKYKNIDVYKHNGGDQK